MITQYKSLLIIVLFIVLLVISGQIVKLWGAAKGGIVSYRSCWRCWRSGRCRLLAVRFRPACDDLQDTANAIKGFVIASALIGCVIGGAVGGVPF